MPSFDTQTIVPNLERKPQYERVILSIVILYSILYLGYNDWHQNLHHARVRLSPASALAKRHAAREAVVR